MPLRETLQRAHEGLTLHFYFGSGVDLLARVRLREIDCAVTSTRFTDPTLDAARLHQEDYMLVGSPKLLEERPLTHASHAAGHTLIDISPELPLYQVKPELDHRRLQLVFPEVRPLFDHFRLVFRSDDARRPLFEAIGRTLLEHPLR